MEGEELKEALVSELCEKNGWYYESPGAEETDASLAREEVDWFLEAHKRLSELPA